MLVALDASNDARGSRARAWCDGITFDLRVALRGLQRDRAFSLAAIAMLALAIGLNATAFTVMNAMLFRGLPLATRSDRLVYVHVRRPSGPSRVSYTDFDAWRSQAESFEGLAFEGGGGNIIFRAGRGRPFDTATSLLIAIAWISSTASWGSTRQPHRSSPSWPCCWPPSGSIPFWRIP